MMELTHIINQTDLKDTHRTFNSNPKEHAFISVARGTSSKTDHILGHKASLNKYKKTEITPCDVGFPSVCYEYILLPLVNKEAALVYGRAEYR